LGSTDPHDIATLSTTQKALLVVSLPVTYVFLYFLFRKFEDHDEGQEEINSKVVSSQHISVEVSVPQDVVGAVIGVKGTQIRLIQEKTKTRINFKDDYSGQEVKERMLSIRGRREDVRQAEFIVRQIIADQPPVISFTVYVPQKAIGRIIGKNGESIRTMCRQSKAKITVEMSDNRNGNGLVPIHLRGSQISIETAKVLLLEKTNEERGFQSIQFKATDSVSAGGSKNLSSNNLVQSATNDSMISYEAMSEASAQNNEVHTDCYTYKLSNEYQPVYVSAVEHPGHFWIQLINSFSLQLELLQQQLTNYYSVSESATDELLGFKIGDVVAAPFSFDDCWYRAQIQALDGDDVDLYYVDYGDSCLIPRSRIKSLRNDFLSLPFQALECSLFGVKPLWKDNSEWSSAAVDAFEELTHTAKWKVLMCRTIDSISDELVESYLPVVQLTDTSGLEDTDIAEELIKRGFAISSATFLNDCTGASEDY